MLKSAPLLRLKISVYGLTLPLLLMTTYVNKTSSSAFFYLYNIRHIREFLSLQHTETLIHAFITSRLDYCNSLLYGLQASSNSKCIRPSHLLLPHVLPHHPSSH